MMPEKKKFTPAFDIVVLLITAAIVVILLPQKVQASEQQKLAITSVRLIDGTGADVVENAMVLVKGDTITYVGPAKPIPAGYKIIEGQGKTLMPGLADMHVHLTDGGDGFDFLGYQRRLNALLYAGVTTVLDTGGVLPFLQQMKQAINVGKIPGPEIYYVGPLIDSVDPTWPVISRSMASVDQAIGIAKYLKKNGASAIKAYANLSRPQMYALVRAGKEVGLPVIVDAWVRNGMEHMVTLGLRAFAHTPSRVTPQTLNTMRKRNVLVMSTLAIGEYSSRAKQGDVSFLESALLTQTMTPWSIAELRQTAEKIDDNDAIKPLPYYKTQLANLKMLYDAGIKIVAGTDDMGYFTGEELHRELEQLVEAGLTPIEAIASATGNAALLLNMEKQWGTIKPGLKAHLLLINGDPDRQISQTRNIELVIKNGVVVERSKLVFNEATDSGVRHTNASYF